MDAARIGRLWGEIERELRLVDPCFTREEPRAHLRTYIRGQLSDIPRKSIEPIALAQSTPPRTLQKFLSQHAWDESGMRNRMQRLVACEHADEHAVGVIDDTAHPKKGRHTPGVKRQYCGATGKVDNCTISVHLAYAGDGMRVLLDSDVYVPKEWAEDAARRRDAGIPESVEFREKWRIALSLLERATANGVRFRWLTFDEGYGQGLDFLFALSDRGHRWVAEVPTGIHGWVREPRVMRREHGRRAGRPRRKPRVFVQDSRVSSVENLFRHSPAFRDQPWTPLRVKDTTTGPVVWEVKRARFWLRRDGLPTAEHGLVVARHALTGEIKYFVTNAPSSVRIEEIVSVAFTRWTVERCFEDAKTELGLSHFEVRNWRSLTRHLLLTSLGLLVLSRVTSRHRPKSAGPHRVPDADGGRRVAAGAMDVPRQVDRIPPARGRRPRAIPQAGRRIHGCAPEENHRKAA
jgi:SRSO17 transposase